MTTDGTDKGTLLTARHPRAARHTLVVDICNMSLDRCLLRCLGYLPAQLLPRQ